MIVKYLHFFALLLLINKVSAQNDRVINATLGHSIILPCLTSPSINVYWQYKENTVVCDIIEGKVDFTDQDSAYKGRVKSFPTEFSKGNFSIKLTNLKRSDAGIYTCNFSGTNPKNLQRAHLNVIENGSWNILPSDGLLLFLLGCSMLSNFTI